jgi:L-methionine (R)-S-oxide reductase
MSYLHELRGRSSPRLKPEDRLVPDSKLLNELRNIVAQNLGREAKAKRIADAIRADGAYRWVGLYDVDYQRGMVMNIAWSGYSPPANPGFPITMGITSRAIAEGRTINVGDVASDAGYLTVFDSTKAEIIVPVLDRTDRAIGTLDVESEHMNAFDAEAQTLLEECSHLLEDFWIDVE